MGLVNHLCPALTQNKEEKVLIRRELHDVGRQGLDGPPGADDVADLQDRRGPRWSANERFPHHPSSAPPKIPHKPVPDPRLNNDPLLNRNVRLLPFLSGGASSAHLDRLLSRQNTMHNYTATVDQTFVDRKVCIF